MRSRSKLTQLARENLFDLWLQGGSGGEMQVLHSRTPNEVWAEPIASH
jgi:hypothetical protein